MSQNKGTLVSAAIRPNDSLDQIASAYSNEIKGGAHGYETFNEMLDIPLPRRQWGMSVNIYNDGINNATYQLKYGYNNGSTDLMDDLNWVKIGLDTKSTSEWVDSVISILIVEPSWPSAPTPNVGDRYLLGTTTGSAPFGLNWDSYSATVIAEYNNIGTWDITNPINGMTVRVDDDNNSMYKYEGVFPTGEWKQEKITKVFYIEPTSVNGVTYSVNTEPVFNTYSRDLIFLTKFNTGNIGSASININGLGYKDIKVTAKNGIRNLIISDILPNTIYTLTYTGTHFQITKPFPADAYNIQYYISPGEIVTIQEYEQYWVYGDLTIEGTIVNYGQLIVANGQVNLINTGNIDNQMAGEVILLDLSNNILFNTTDTIQLTSEITVSGPSVSAIVLNDSLKTYHINSVNNPTASYLLSNNGSGSFEWVSSGLSSIINVTYSELVALVAGSLLKPGQTYLLTDYETTWDANGDSFSSGVPEPLYITATDVNKLSNECRSKLYPQDIVFYEITGDIGNDVGTEGFTKGKIYRRIDTLRNNDIGTDWRHVTYRRYQLDDTLVPDYTQYSGYLKGDVVMNTIGGNQFYICIEDDPYSISLSIDKWTRFMYLSGDKRSLTDGGIIIPLQLGVYGTIPAIDIVYEDFLMFPDYSEVYNNTIQTYSLTNTIIYSTCKNNNIGDNFRNNTINNITDCNIKSNFYSNYIENMHKCDIGLEGLSSTYEYNGFRNNIIRHFESNTINGRFDSNLINTSFSLNNIKSHFAENILIAESFRSNNIGIGFTTNIITNTISLNYFSGNFNSNTIHPYVSNCQFGCNIGNLLIPNQIAPFSSWIFGDNIDGSVIALPELGEEYTKKLVNANGTYVIEYIDEYGDDVIVNLLESFAFRSNQESLIISGINNTINPTNILLIDWGDASIFNSTGISFIETHVYTGKLNTDEYNIRIVDNDLGQFYLSNNQLTYFDPINLPSSLVALYLDNNQLTSFNPTNSLPISLNIIDISDNQLDTIEVNNTLVMLNDRYTDMSVSKYFYLKMSPAATPSGAGLTAKLELELKGYFVDTD